MIVQGFFGIFPCKKELVKGSMNQRRQQHCRRSDVIARREGSHGTGCIVSHGGAQFPCQPHDDWNHRSLVAELFLEFRFVCPPSRDC